MQCPNRECGTTVDEGALVCPECGTDLAQPARIARTGRLATASVILGIVACVLPWVGAAVLTALGFKPEWAPPFAGTLIPVSYVPFEVAKIASLLIALAAVVMGHLAISRGGGTRRALIGALFIYPLAGLFILFFTPVPRFLSQVIPFYAELALYALNATPVAFFLVHLVAGFRRVRRTGGVIWRPVLGAMLGYFNIALIVLLTLSLFSKGRHSWDRAVCSNNLKAVGMVLREYAERNRGMYPPLSSQPGVLMFSPEGIPHNEIIGPRGLTCPLIRYAEQPTTGPASPFDDQSYFYLGYAVLNDDAVEAFAKAYREQVAKGGTFDQDLVVEDANGTHVIPRLSVTAKEVLRASQDPLSASPYAGQSAGYQEPTVVTDDVPILIERDMGHVYHRYVDWDGRPRGAYVLYLNDGLQYVAPGTWPITEKTQRILAELAQSPPK